MTAIYSLISMSVLLWLVFGLHNAYRVDRLRQELFEIRDELFDQAMGRNVAFDSRAYRAVRTTLNGMIRFAHQVSLSRVLMGTLIFRETDFSDIANEFENALNASSKRERDICKVYLHRANDAIARHLYSSPYAYLFIVPILIAAVCAILGHSFGTWLVKRLRPQFSALDRMAYSEGLAQYPQAASS